MKLSGDLNTPALPMTDAQVNHLRRLLAWMRCEWMLDPDGQRGYVEAAGFCVEHGYSTPEQAGAVLAEAAQKINRCPTYVRQAVKMLTKALRDHERSSGIVDTQTSPLDESTQDFDALANGPRLGNVPPSYGRRTKNRD